MSVIESVRSILDGPIAVLMGGESSERDISLQSGAAVVEALTGAGLDVVAVDCGRDLAERLQSISPGFAFIALHGRGGEDGVVQQLLEKLDIPYSGSGVESSAVAIDKVATKLRWQEMDLPTPAMRVLAADTDFAEVSERFPGRIFVKPVSEGSSMGMAVVEGDDEDKGAALQRAYVEAANYDSQVFAEQYVDGPEYTVAIVDGYTLPSIRIETTRTFYDFNAKYVDEDTRFSLPSGLKADEEQEIQSLARRAFDGVGCRHWGRVDIMRQGDTGKFLLLEVNTVPGLTSHSLVPMAAKEGGLDFLQLALVIVDASLKEREACS